MSWFNRIKNALSKTSNAISSKISDALYKKRLDQETLDKIHEALIAADVGVKMSAYIISSIKNKKFEQDVTTEEIKEMITSILSEVMEDTYKEFSIVDGKLNIVLVCGVNGNGKTTTIGKLANLYNMHGKKVVIAACDTFRAAAREQLFAWGEMSSVEVISGDEKRDPASLAYEAIEVAQQKKADLLLIDTAGRLQTHTNLMTELAKIIKVIKKRDETAPHHTLLVLDATTGQNAYSQVKMFVEVASVNGLIITKLDGTAKAGVIVGITEEFKIPVYFIGVGEGLDDLQLFKPNEFASALIGF